MMKMRKDKQINKNENQIKFDLHISKPVSRNIKYFVYRGEKYFVNFDLLVLNCNYFYENQEQYKYVQEIPLLNEEEDNHLQFTIPTESIKAFISSCQNESCQIDITSIIYLQYLSNKYEYNKLSDRLNEIIHEHFDELIFEILYFKIKQNNHDFDTTSEEEIISNHMREYIEDERKISLPIPILKRIIDKYFQLNKENSLEEDERIIISFLMKVLDKRGNESSILFNNLDIGKTNIDIVYRLLNEYSDIFDFNMINSSLLKTTKELMKDINKERYSYERLFQDMRLEIENEKSEIRIMKEQLSTEIQEERRKSEERKRIFEDELNHMRIIYEERISNIIEEINKIKEREKELNEQETIHKYERSILESINMNTLNDMSQTTRKHIIHEIISNEPEITKIENQSSNEIIQHILILHRLYDSISTMIPFHKERTKQTKRTEQGKLINEEILDKKYEFIN